MAPIPANLILGFLGVGKTTAVIDLLKRKPVAEKWAVLVNEYGTVSVDDAFIEGEAPDGVSVRSVAGGCFCCTTAPMLPVALHFLLRDMRPDRLLIETSGLGHPAALVDTLREKYADRLELRAAVGIVTPSDFAAPGMIDSNPVFRDQIQLSDVLVLNKLDTATPELVRDFQAWANGLFPPKLLVAATEQGRLEVGWLDLVSDLTPPAPLSMNGEGGVQPAQLENHRRELATAQAVARSQAPGDDKRVSPLNTPSPFMERGPGGEVQAMGWLFPPETVFDEPALLAALARPEITRLKGVFRCEHGWVAVNRAGGQTTVKPTAYRRDSRVEAFAEVPDWGAFEAEMMGCQMANPGATAGVRVEPAG